jgi:hypothetical protein
MGSAISAAFSYSCSEMRFLISSAQALYSYLSIKTLPADFTHAFSDILSAVSRQKPADRGFPLNPGDDPCMERGLSNSHSDTF